MSSKSYKVEIPAESACFVVAAHASSETSIRVFDHDHDLILKTDYEAPISLHSFRAVLSDLRRLLIAIYKIQFHEKVERSLSSNILMITYSFIKR